MTASFDGTIWWRIANSFMEFLCTMADWRA